MLQLSGSCHAAAMCNLRLLLRYIGMVPASPCPCTLSASIPLAENPVTCSHV